ncbi:DUF4113 domain-containing protein [Klebsiella pneumoniae]|uniref:DUF4113 domain-containing protein n=1 Tax=Klebsiella pneumoniae TaxID=573 RepID=A0A939NTS5_KLEPN|nr:DUF4113 domain-containing protein [Klebsiella pneumoniae]
MEAMDAINDRYGKRKVVIGAQGFQNKHSESGYAFTTLHNKTFRLASNLLNII